MPSKRRHQYTRCFSTYWLSMLISGIYLSNTNKSARCISSGMKLFAPRSTGFIEKKPGFTPEKVYPAF